MLGPRCGYGSVVPVRETLRLVVLPIVQLGAPFPRVLCVKTPLMLRRRRVEWLFLFFLGADVFVAFILGMRMFAQKKFYDVPRFFRIAFCVMSKVFMPYNFITRGSTDNHNGQTV